MLRLQKQYGVHDPELPQKRKAPTHYKVGARLGPHSCTVVDVHPLVYFECLDHVVSCIQDRFNQPGYAVLRQLEGEGFDQELESVVEQYKNNFTRSSLTAQLDLLPAALQSHHQHQPITSSHCQQLRDMHPAEA